MIGTKSFLDVLNVSNVFVASLGHVGVDVSYALAALIPDTCGAAPLLWQCDELTKTKNHHLYKNELKFSQDAKLLG